MTFIGAFMVGSILLVAALCLPRVKPVPQSALFVCECGNVCRAAGEQGLNAQSWRLVYGHACCPECLDRPAPAHIYGEAEDA